MSKQMIDDNGTLRFVETKTKEEQAYEDAVGLLRRVSQNKTSGVAYEDVMQALITVVLYRVHTNE